MGNFTGPVKASLSRLKSPKLTNMCRCLALLRLFGKEMKSGRVDIDLGWCSNTDPFPGFASRNTPPHLQCCGSLPIPLASSSFLFFTIPSLLYLEVLQLFLTAPLSPLLSVLCLPCACFLSFSLSTPFISWKRLLT